MEKHIKEILETRLTSGQSNALKKIRNIFNYQIKSRLCLRNLPKLAEIYSSDKWGEHWYASHYQKHFQSMRKRKLNILEIGVGGYNSPEKGGASLRMWKRYFPNSMVYSMDIYDKSFLEEKRIKIFKGNQADESFLKNVFHETGPLDIIIDDGSHINSHVITSFKVLFPLLNDEGIYAIEDTQSSYWPKIGDTVFGGSSDNLNDTATMMGYFKSLTDGLNYAEFIKPGYTPDYFDKHIVSMHFYHNLIFIYKGHNDEKSNIVQDDIA